MRLTVLGSGTLLPDDDRRSAAHLVEDGRIGLLLDCGAGTVHGLQRHGVDWPALTHLALSHFHTDHVGDVPALLFALHHGVRPPRVAPLTVLGPPGVLDFFDALTVAFGSSVSDPGFPVQVRELGRDDGWDDPAGELRVRTHPTRHTGASVAWRVEGRTGIVGYTGDTGPEPGLAAFFAGVDVLVTECSFPDPPPMDTHMTPLGVAELAREAGPGLVLLTHLQPGLDPEAAPSLVREGGFPGPVETAWDGTAVEIGAGPPRVVVRPSRDATRARRRET